MFILQPLKSLIICVFSMFLITACATTNELAQSDGIAKEHKTYYGTWKIIKVVLQNGEIKDFSNAPANYVHIKEAEITEEIAGYGIKNYNYIEKNSLLIVMAGNRVSTWSIVKSTQSAMEIETPAGRYVLVRKAE